jgi:large subunit ribosomal protein L7Ae
MGTITSKVFSQLLMSRLNDQPKAKGTGKKPAPAPHAAGKAPKIIKNPLFESRPKNFGIGACPQKTVLTLCLCMITQARMSVPKLI